MGRANDTTAVVDSHARVRGVSNLRVVDASAFPILPPGQPQSTACKLCSPSVSHLHGLCCGNIELTCYFSGTDMFAERIAQFILDGE